MGTAKDAHTALKRAEASLSRDIEKIIKSLTKEIIDLVRRDQLLNEGISPTGMIIGVYSKATDNITRGKAGPGYPKNEGAPFNFLESGEMWSSYSIKFGDDKLTIVNTSMSLDLFMRKFRVPEEGIVGFTDYNKNKINYDLILPKLREIFRNKFQ